jgi:glycosyltransferase involved in cell wall biosynthesis
LRKGHPDECVGEEDDLARVSVIIPAYNQAGYLREAIESAVNQEIDDLEIVLVDDASEDDTHEVASSYAESVLHLRNDVNRGVSNSRNRGIAVSTGEYLVFLDADDVLLEDKLRSQSQYLDEHPDVGVVYCDCLLCDSTGSSLATRFSEVRPPRSGSVFEPLCRGNFLPIHAAMVRRRCLDSVGDFQEAFQPNEDWHLWLRLAGVTRFHYDERVLCKYRLHMGNVSHNRFAMSRANALVRLWLVQSPLFPQLSTRTQHYCYLSCGVSLAKTGDLPRARQMLRKAVHLRPFYIPGHALWALSLAGQDLFTLLENAVKRTWLRVTGRARIPLPQ